MCAKKPSEVDVEATVSHGQTASVADPYGELQRDLKQRHVQFIALGGTIGTGLFLGIGGALATSGPLSLFLGYSFTSIAIWCMMQCLGEMTSILPMPGMIAQLGSRFVDPALGFAIGWNQWYNCAIAICAETSGAVVFIRLWTDINSAAWISIILAVVVLLNVIAVTIYGEAEFVFAGIKIVTIIGLLILAVVIDLGGGPSHERIGFRYWQHPGAMREYLGTGPTGRFLGLFATLINASFAFGGVEQVAVAAGETRNPTRNIPKAIRRVVWRLLFFYVLGSLAIGVLVPYTDSSLLYGSGIAQSPWIIAISNAGIPVLPSILNAVFVTSASSSANANLYTGSRYLYALAQQGSCFISDPQGKTLAGLPGVAITGAFGLLSYMTVTSGGANVFHWFSSLVTIAFLLTWASICFAYTRFRRALIYRQIDRATLPFKSPGQPYLAWGGLAFFSIILVFNGFSVFTRGNWNVRNFIAAYIGLPIFSALYCGWKVAKKTKLVPISEIDLFTGRVNDEVDSDTVRNLNTASTILSKAWSKVF